jgi:hypothetical protein
LTSPEHDPLTASKFSDIISEESSYEVSTMPVDQTLIFKLLQAFKLQQYAKKMQEFGFGMEIYKLAIMNETEKLKLIDDLKPLPGHQYKFEDMFTFIETIYPRESAARELKRSSNNAISSPENEHRFIAISGSNPKR